MYVQLGIGSYPRLVIVRNSSEDLAEKLPFPRIKVAFILFFIYVHVPKPYITTGLITVLYTNNLRCLVKKEDLRSF